jgi:histone H3/H4
VSKKSKKAKKADGPKRKAGKVNPATRVSHSALKQVVKDHSGVHGLRVSSKALELIASHVYDRVVNVANNAFVYMSAAKRNTMKLADVKTAISNSCDLNLSRAGAISTEGMAVTVGRAASILKHKKLGHRFSKDAITLLCQSIQYEIIVMSRRLGLVVKAANKLTVSEKMVRAVL